jgi:hypothetical protein
MWLYGLLIVAAYCLILAPSRPKLGRPRPWQDEAWDIYDSIASGPAD